MGDEPRDRKADEQSADDWVLELEVVRVQVASNFAARWLEIAISHEHSALEARAEIIATGKPSSSDYDHAPDARTLERRRYRGAELRASMVTIAAAAFAIDALYGQVVDLLGPTDVPTTSSSRAGRIVETFKVALDLGPLTQRWQRAIPDLFDLRDTAVHHRATLNEPQRDATGYSYVAVEDVTYSAEQATAAVDLLLEVMHTVYASPRPRHAALVEWAERHGGVLPVLEAERQRQSD